MDVDEAKALVMASPVIATRPGVHGRSTASTTESAMLIVRNDGSALSAAVELSPEPAVPRFDGDDR
jgi:hypothetical protein